MVTKKRPNIYSKLTPFEKEALLYALLQHNEPTEAINQMLISSVEHTVRWDGYKKEVNPALMNILTKLGKSNNVSASWISPQTALINVEDIFIELDLLCKNSYISARAKAVGALLIFEFYLDVDLRLDSDKQKILIHNHSLIKTDSFFDIYGELKSTSTKALKELSLHSARYQHHPTMNEYKERFIPLQDWDTKRAEIILSMLRNTTISWLAKGLMLFHFLYNNIHPTLVACFCSESNTDNGYNELIDKKYFSIKD